MSHKIVYRPIRPEDTTAVAELIKLCFPQMPEEDQYTAEDLAELAELFPEGTIIAWEGDTVVGMGTGILTDIDFENFPRTEWEMLYDGEKNKHNPQGEYYYGSDIAVHPNYRRRGIGRNLYRHRKALVRERNLKGFVAAGVLPGYERFIKKLDIRTYVNRVIKGELHDSTLSMQLKNGFTVRRLLKDYFVYPRSDNWSALIVWRNPTYQPPDSKDRKTFSKQGEGG